MFKVFTSAVILHLSKDRLNRLKLEKNLNRNLKIKKIFLNLFD